MATSHTDNSIGLVGLIIISSNIYWLMQLEFTFNDFTYHSWAMLLVGLILIYPMATKAQLFGTHLIKCRECGENNDSENINCHSCGSKLPG